MSYSPEQMYPGAFTPDSNFLGGKFKNSTAPGVYDGTPLDNLLFNQTLALLDAAMIEAGFDYNNTEDTPQDSQLHKALQATRQVEPLNNDYNGYLAPGHQSSLPSGAGYPGGSGSPTTYGLDNEISRRIYSGSAGNSVSSDDDGWIFSGSIYKEYAMTSEQISLIDVNSVNVFVKDELGVSYFWKNGDTGVTVSKPTSTTLRVTLDSAIFGVITKLWRFFVTEKVGYVGELGADTVDKYFQVASGSLGSNGYYITGDKVNGNPVIFQWGNATNSGGGVGTHSFPIPFPNAVLSMTASDVQNTPLSDFGDVFSVNLYVASNTEFEAILNSESTAANIFNYIAIGY